ncbi:hypothetical protein MA16_Dca007778 [Dendrobium catenatum]|uniref:Uncharacterized protein n=1 Tax=Dendrobium catenatum TaxID=906689 RepID=A0A2I0X5E2_9ASPA|nr:hypothetical protein MA16_Dca007778 [Dendrobium catenatum]
MLNSSPSKQPVNLVVPVVEPVVEILPSVESLVLNVEQDLALLPLVTSTSNPPLLNLNLPQAESSSSDQPFPHLLLHPSQVVLANSFASLPVDNPDPIEEDVLDEEISSSSKTEEVLQFSSCGLVEVLLLIEDYMGFLLGS